MYRKLILLEPIKYFFSCHYTIDQQSVRIPLTMVEYQFDKKSHPFTITSHGNQKKANTCSSYRRTQPSTLNKLKAELVTSHPRKATDSVSEQVGGIIHGRSASAWPRNVTQAYNLNKTSSKTPVVSTNHRSDDPYLSLVMLCKEQEKYGKTAYVRKVICAPEPIVLLMKDEQLDDIAKFCTNKAHFGIFQADPTFNLGLFSVTTTQYEHLLLLNRRSAKHPVMVGPIMVHQRKEKSTYKIFADGMVAKKPELRNLLALGTDGEVALSDAFLDVCQGARHLICFNHFQNNITDHLKSVGIDEANRRLISADIFGQQVGTTFEEGIVDSDDVEEFDARVQSIRSTWEERIGKKGTTFHDWFVKYKSNLMKKHLLKPVRIDAGLGNPPSRYVSNRVECVNSLLKRETERKESPVDQFVKTMQGTV